MKYMHNHGHHYEYTNIHYFEDEHIYSYSLMWKDEYAHNRTWRYKYACSIYRCEQNIFT